MTDDAYYRTTLPVTCPKCGKASAKLLRELVANTMVLCGYCPTAIDIGTAEWRARIDQAVAGARAKKGQP